MKRISEKVLPNGNRRCIVELAKDEFLVAFKQDAHYKMPDPMDYVVHSDFLISAVRVVWASDIQEWLK